MTLKPSQFTKINEGFLCVHCGFSVPKAQSTCRDHCPKCLFSLHVDNNPGDREAKCGGLLKPMSWSQNKKKGYVIHYHCQKCGIKKVNKFLQQDVHLPDDLTVLIQLSNIS